jgi:predicted alpha/beta-fold hydrolase
LPELGALFQPPAGLRSPHTQSLVNSSTLRRRVGLRRAARLLAAQQEWIMDGGPAQGGPVDGDAPVRLLGHYSPQKNRKASRGLVVLLHGWEGSTTSNYMLTTGALLFDAGFDVFRLNFRDHGESHHLNPGIFHSCRLDEVIHALGDLQERTGAQQWGLAGFSLGGNFALRVARHGPAKGLSIGHAFAVCPALDPARVLNTMEAAPPIYQKYYIKKWARSMRIKQRCFPDLYDYDEWFILGGLRARTEYFATRYYEFDSIDAYLDGYSVVGDRLEGLTVPTTLLTAEDDPVIPVSDALELPVIDKLEVLTTRYGGHCAYLQNWALDSWAEQLILSRFLAPPHAATMALLGSEDWHPDVPMIAPPAEAPLEIPQDLARELTD